MDVDDSATTLSGGADRWAVARRGANPRRDVAAAAERVMRTDGT